MEKFIPDPDQPTNFDSLDDAAEAHAEPEADIDAGQVVPHERVREWLMKLAAGKYEPPPEPDGCG